MLSFRRLLTDSDCAILASFHLQLRCARWQIKLALWHDSHMYVSPLFVQTALPCSMTDTVNTLCRPLRNYCSHVLVLSSV